LPEVISGLEKVKSEVSNLADSIEKDTEASEELYDLLADIDDVLMHATKLHDAAKDVHTTDAAIAMSVLPMVFEVVEKVGAFKERHGLENVKRGAKRSQSVQASSEAPDAAVRPIKRAKRMRSD
jgi:heme exporter protein D